MARLVETPPPPFTQCLWLPIHLLVLSDAMVAWYADHSAVESECKQAKINLVSSAFEVKYVYFNTFWAPCERIINLYG